MDDDRRPYRKRDDPMFVHIPKEEMDRILGRSEKEGSKKED